MFEYWQPRLILVNFDLITFLNTSFCRWFSQIIFKKCHLVTAKLNLINIYENRYHIDGLVQNCKKDANPVLTHWSYIFLALTHRYDQCQCYQIFMIFAQQSFWSMTFTGLRCLCVCYNPVILFYHVANIAIPRTRVDFTKVLCSRYNTTLALQLNSNTNLITPNFAHTTRTWISLLMQNQTMTYQWILDICRLNLGSFRKTMICIFSWNPPRPIG